MSSNSQQTVLFVNVKNIGKNKLPRGAKVIYDEVKMLFKDRRLNSEESDYRLHDFLEGCLKFNSSISTVVLPSGVDIEAVKNLSYATSFAHLTFKKVSSGTEFYRCAKKNVKPDVDWNLDEEETGKWTGVVYEVADKNAKLVLIAEPIRVNFHC